MKIEISEDGSIQPFQADKKGRITLGKEFAGDRVRVAILSRLDDAEDVPSELPRFDGPVAASEGDEGGEGQATDSRFGDLPRTDREAALLGITDHDRPYWFGFSAETGTEVGVDPETHRGHVLIAGLDSILRATALAYQWRQIITRGAGGILYLSDDSLMPRFRRRVQNAGRSDDIIEINPMSPAPSGTNVLGLSEQHDGQRAIKKTMDVLLKVTMSDVPDRAGDAIWNIVSETEGEATLADVHYIFSSELTDGDPDEPLVTPERAQWLYETVPKTDLSDDEREAVIERLQHWLENKAVRDGIADAGSTMTISEAIDEQKLIVVRRVHSTGIPSAMITLAAVVRAWHTRSTQRSRDSESPYYVVTDDIERLADAGPLSDFLAASRSHRMTLVGGCKRLSGWENREDILDRFNTYLTFRPRRSDGRACASLHSGDITQADLLDLPGNTAYLRTQSGSQQLESIKVETFEQRRPSA